MTDEFWIYEAYQEARNAYNAGCMPFGAILVDNTTNKIICRAQNACMACNKRGGSGTGDVTRHAEMELIRSTIFTKLTIKERENCTLYTSTEPCVMCAGAIYWSGIKTIVYGCSAIYMEKQISGPGGLDIPILTLYQDAARVITVRGPILEEEGLKVHIESGVWSKQHQQQQKQQQQQHKSAEQDIAVEASLKTSGLGSAAVCYDNVVPIIDMSQSDKSSLTEELWTAASQVGFFTVINHGIGQEIIDAAFETSAKFFEQPVSDKQIQSPLDMSINCGFESFTQVRPSTGLPDQKESIQVTARKGCMDNRWPSPDFQQVSNNLIDAAHDLSLQILTLLEPKATPHLQPGTLSAAHTLWGDTGQCTLRYLHYPAMNDTATTKDVEQLITDGYWRAGPHTDWDSITLLFQRPGQDGLECCANPRTATDPSQMYWTAIPPVPGGISINIGDMLSRWSDGRLYSNLHRVRLPNPANNPRYSIAFFAQADKEVLIDSPGTEPITAGDYILSRIRSNFATDK